MHINTLKFINYIANKTKSPRYIVTETISEQEMDNFVLLREDGQNAEANDYLEQWQDDIKIKIELLTKMSELFEMIKR